MLGTHLQMSLLEYSVCFFCLLTIGGGNIGDVIAGVLHRRVCDEVEEGSVGGDEHWVRDVSPTQLGHFWSYRVGAVTYLPTQPQG